jgi:hypothetical protein
MYFLSNRKRTPVIIQVCCSTFVRVCSNLLCTKVRECLYVTQNFCFQNSQNVPKDTLSLVHTTVSGGLGSWYSNLLRAGRSRDEVPVPMTFCVPVQTSPKTQSVPWMSNRSIPCRNVAGAWGL